MKPNKPYSSITNRIIFDRRLLPIDKAVYMTMNQHAYGKDLECYPSQDRIAFLCGVSLTTVKESIGRLVQYGYLIAKRTGKKLNNNYVLLPFAEADTKIFIATVEHEWDVHVADVKSRREAAKKLKASANSDSKFQAYHSEGQSEASTESDSKFQGSDSNFTESDSNFTGGVIGLELATNNTNSNKANPLINQIRNLISEEQEITPGGKDSLKENIGDTSDSVPPEPVKEASHSSDSVPPEPIKEVEPVHAGAAALIDKPKQKLTPPRAVLKLFSGYYELSQGSQYYYNDEAKTLSQAKQIWSALSKCYESTLKHYYENVFSREPDCTPIASFLHDIHDHAFRNVNAWAFKQVPTVGLFLKHIDAIINSFFEGLNKQLRNMNEPEIRMNGER